MTPRAVVIGVSAGGLDALRTVIASLRPDFPLPVVVVQHLSPDSDSFLPVYLDTLAALTVKEAEDKELLTRQTVYIAPPDYHLLVEPDHRLSLSQEPKVNFSRPAVDVLFETAAEAYGPGLVGIVLTGANHDGAKGLARIKRLGGLTIVQSPETAFASAMPLAAIDAAKPDHVLPLDSIGPFLNTLIPCDHDQST